MEFLCKKFTNLFGLLQDAEAAKAGLEKENVRLGSELERWKKRGESEAVAQEGVIGRLREDLECAKSERHAVLVERENVETER